MTATHTMSAVFCAERPHCWLSATVASITDLQYAMLDDDCGQLSTVLAAEQHELDAAMAGLLHMRLHEPDSSTVVEPLALALASAAAMAVAVDVAALKGEESTSKKPEFMTQSA